MTGALLPLFVALPLLVGGILVAAGRRPRTHQVTAIALPALSFAGSIALILDVATNGLIGHAVGLWPAGIAIPFAADMLAALMLATTSFLAVVCSLFARASGADEGRFFTPMMLIMLGGVNGAILTADLFNLFVFIEVMLLPAYALLVLAPPGAGTLRAVRGARLSVVVNLLTSTVFLVGVGFIYGAAGTVNLGELTGTAVADPIVAAAASVCLFALGIKAAIVPVHGWLANAYPATSPAVTALLSGLHTKVAVYAMFRIFSQMFEGDEWFRQIGMVVFVATMVVGVLAAVGAGTTRSILAFHMVSQIGYILIGLALFSGAGLAAGIFYLVHNMIAKTGLFLAAGAVEVRTGAGALDRLGGMAKREPVIAVAFFVCALSMAGLPPFSGFLAKLTLAGAAIDVGAVWVVAAMLIVSLVTLLSMLKIWSGVFWGDPPWEADTPGGGSLRTAAPPRVGAALAAPAVMLAGVTLALGVGGEVLLVISDIAAQSLLDPSIYRMVVIGK